jgi:hypothetical protein
MRREPGDAVLLRYVHGGRVSRALPVTVVEDTPEHVCLHVASGSPMKTRCGLDGVPIRRDMPYAERFSLQWRLCDGVWEGNSVLMLTPVGAGHSFWAVWDESGRFEGWYVNVQEPLRPTRFGFDTADNVLDVVIGPDLSSWRLKDEHELEEAIRVRRFTQAEAEAVREEARLAVATLDALAWPFDRDWRDWQPDPDWPRAELSDDPLAYTDVSRGQSPGHVREGH